MDPHTSSMGFRSGLLAGFFHKLTVVFKEMLDIFTCMLWVVILI